MLMDREHCLWGNLLFNKKDKNLDIWNKMRGPDCSVQGWADLGRGYLYPRGWGGGVGNRTCRRTQAALDSAACGVHTRPDSRLCTTDVADLGLFFRAREVEAASGMPSQLAFPSRSSQSQHTLPSGCPAVPPECPVLTWAAWGDPRLHQWKQDPQPDEDREHAAGRTSEQRSRDGEIMKVDSPNPFDSWKS